MDRHKEILKNSIINNNERDIIDMLNNRLDPNFENGWPIRLAARYGHYSIVQILIHYGANPHLLSESGAATLQLAVYSALHWDTDNWTFLLSCCDSSQLADGAAVAIIFNKVAALKKILQTGRCNTNIPTTLTGKTLEDLAKGYKLQYLLNTPFVQNSLESTSTSSLRVPRTNSRQPHAAHRNLSPSVAQFFDLTASQPALTPPRSPLRSIFPPTAQQL